MSISVNPAGTQPLPRKNNNKGDIAAGVAGFTGVAAGVYAVKTGKLGSIRDKFVFSKVKNTVQDLSLGSKIKSLPAKVKKLGGKVSKPAKKILSEASGLPKKVFGKLGEQNLGEKVKNAVQDLSLGSKVKSLPAKAKELGGKVSEPVKKVLGNVATLSKKVFGKLAELNFGEKVKNLKLGEKAKNILGKIKK